MADANRCLAEPRGLLTGYPHFQARAGHVMSAVQSHCFPLLLGSLVSGEEVKIRNFFSWPVMCKGNQSRSKNHGFAKLTINSASLF